MDPSQTSRRPSCWIPKLENPSQIYLGPSQTSRGRPVESPNLRTLPNLFGPSQTSRRPSCRTSRLFETPPYLFGIQPPAVLSPDYLRTPPAPRRDQLCAYRPITPHMKWNNIIKIVTLKTKELKPWLFPLWIHTIPHPPPRAGIYHETFKISWSNILCKSPNVAFVMQNSINPEVFEHLKLSQFDFLRQIPRRLNSFW